MKQSLQLRLSQQLVMTPQLQQAIRLLQLSSLDLQVEVQAALDSNLMLERIDESQEVSLLPNLPFTHPVPDADTDRTPTDIAPQPVADTAEAVPVESAWEDIYAVETYSSGSSAAAGYGDDDEWDPYERHASPPESLQEHLSLQMRLTPFNDREIAIATAIIDAINESGYLALPLEELSQGVQVNPAVTLAEVEAVLQQVQRFDPQGVGARSPAECLLLQLESFPEETPYLTEARRLVDQHLELLASRDFNALMRRLKLSREGLHSAISLIQSLQPYPGDRLSNNAAQYVTPDVLVHRRGGVWRVELHPDSTPKIRVNTRYAALARNSAHNSTNGTACLKTHLQEARWFLKSLQNRNETLLKVATCIVERQRAFLERGDEYMKPLVLRDIAEELEMHESTVSRVTTQKYLHTPRGLYELKFFFSSHVGADDGSEYSSTAIRAMIRKLIHAEDPRKPLSDDKIAQHLNAEGIQVARRTVAKYREAMSVPSSSDRRTLF